MNRIDRLINILLMLQSKKFVPIEKLTDKFQLSKRTIFRDIKSLNEIGVPIYFEPSKGYTIAKGYFLPPLSFTPEEAYSLLTLKTLANKFADKSIERNSHTAFEKIKAVLKFSDWDKLDKLSSKIEIFTPTNLINEKQHLSKIQNSIIDKITLEICYVDNSDNTTQRKIEPIGLIFYTNQWHLIAWCTLRKDYRDFKVDKITQLTNTIMPFQKEHTYTIQEYMKKF